jgi:hypothetical protein
MSGPAWHSKSVVERGSHAEKDATAHSPIDKRQRCLIYITCVVELDKLDAPVFASPVKVRNFEVDLERLRYGGQLDMIYQRKIPRRIISFFLSARHVNGSR